MSSIEILSPSLAGIINADSEVTHLGDGFVAAEGPVWVARDHCLLFSDYRASKRYRWSQREGVALVSDATDEGNGQTLDAQGRLYVCERATQRVVRYNERGVREVISDSWSGMRLNSPNDIIIGSDGAAVFTDPISPDYQSVRGYPGVFKISPEDSEPVLLTRELEFPNGLAYSPDEALLYVNDSYRQAMYLVAASEAGALPDTEPSLFFKFSTARGPGVPDGMKVDIEGNVYSTGPGGVWIIDPTGNPLGIISTGPSHHTNLAWGGEDWRTLFILTRESISKIDMKIPGIPVPAKILS